MAQQQACLRALVTHAAAIAAARGIEEREAWGIAHVEAIRRAFSDCSVKPSEARSQ